MEPLLPPLAAKINNCVALAVGRLVRFVLVQHSVRGSIMLLCTDVTLAPLDIIILYAYRYKIELGFRHALHVIGSYAYHFWMMGMTPPS